MTRRFFLGSILLILLSTFVSQNKIIFDRFIVKEIIIKNNEILNDQSIIEDLYFLYNKNIFFLNSYDIKKKLNKKNSIKSLEIKKIYPNKIIIKIFEKEPIAILINNDSKFFLGKKFDIIDYKKIDKFKNLPIIYGDKKNYKELFQNLKSINFPTNLIAKYFLLDSKRWNLELIDQKLIKLPPKDYKKSLKNFLKIKESINFDKYKIFDYRLKNQLILK